MVSTTTFLPYTSTLFSPRPFFLQDPTSFPLKKKQCTYAAVCLSVFRGPKFYCLSLRIFISFEVWGRERGLSLLCFCRYDILLSHQWVCDCIFRVSLLSCYRQSSLQNLSVLVLKILNMLVVDERLCFFFLLLWKQIRFILLQNRQGKTRLAKYYIPLEDSEKHKLEFEVPLCFLLFFPDLKFQSLYPYPCPCLCFQLAGG